MAEQSNDRAPTPDASTQSTGAAFTDNQPGGGAGQAAAGREGEDERRGEGGYGNDTGFATGSVAPRDDEDEAADAGGLSAREQQTSDTYRDTKRAGDAR